MRARNIIWVIFTLCVFLLAFSINAQEKLTSASANTETLRIAGTSENDPNSVQGYWQLTETKSEIYNVANRTKWTEGAYITAISSWIDYLDVEHTIESGFKWDTPPEKLMPGKNLQLAGSFEDREFSTCSRIQSGIKIYVSGNQKGFLHPDAVISNVLYLKKDCKTHNSEINIGTFTAPRNNSKDNNLLHLTIDCYIGSDHYVSTYTYMWVAGKSL